MIRPVQIFGLNVYPFAGREQLLDFVSGRRTLLIAIGAEKLLTRDTRFRAIVNENVGYCDGIAAVWGMRRRGHVVPKIPGASLWLDVVRRLRDKRYYLLGATEEVLGKTVEMLRSEHDLQIVGHHHGYFDDAAYADIKRDILEKRPDVVFVALGSPRQEYVMADLAGALPALYMGLGGSFDLYCGKAQPVPEWWKRVFKWEGIYRQFCDWRNLKRWRRQLRALPILWKLAFDKT